MCCAHAPAQLLQRCLWFGVVDPAGEDSVVVSEKDVWWRASSLLSDHHSVDVVGGGRVGVDGVVLYMFAKRGFLKKGTHAMVSYYVTACRALLLLVLCT